MATKLSKDSRPAWPQRAVVTAGMPYGNKELHFGHVGGVFVPADFFARFLRDRIGAQNVVFVSGTDCYGSPIMESYRKACEAHDYALGISDYVQEKHEAQANTLNAFEVSCDLFAGSNIAPASEVHNRMTEDIVQRLHEQGVLKKLTTKQFYDAKAGQFLNGRQVLGRCPIQGCKSEKAYADECDLGHQFEPEELIAPVSQLSGERPELRPVDNLYFDLPAYTDYLRAHTETLAEDETVRAVVPATMREWLGAPAIYVQEKFRDDFAAVAATLPAHSAAAPEKGKSSFTVTFSNWEDRDTARDLLAAAGVRFRSGKALVPLRISGNIDWGVPLPALEGTHDLTCWVWPESLWAPISFTKTALTLAPEGRYSTRDWRDFWASDDACEYQFIGQDNIYFYCVAQSALWKALDWHMHQSTVVANYHLLYMGKKASSSSQTPPPLARELLDFYTPEQLRAHWISLGLGEKPVSFSPKAFDTRETGKNADGTPLLARDDKRVIDPALKEGAMLTGVFNRLARSCFYGVAPKEGDQAPYRCGCIPAGTPSPHVIEQSEQAILAFEYAMHTFEFHHALSVCDEFLRNANKRWSDASKAAKAAADDNAMQAALVDAFHELHVGTVLMHGIVPAGCELIAQHFAIPAETFFSWDHIFDTCDKIVESLGEKAGTHAIVPLPPRFDFFSKHDSQY